MDFEKWIRERLKEAKAAGLVRLSKTNPASHNTLKAAAAAQAAGMAPAKTAFGSTYNPNKYTRRSTDAEAVNDTASQASKGKAPTGKKKRNAGVEDTVAAALGSAPGGAPSYEPLVFKPPSPPTSRGELALPVKSPAKPPKSPAKAEAARRRAASSSATAQGRDPNLPWFAQRPSAYAVSGAAGEPFAAANASKMAWDSTGVDSNAVLLSGALKPGPDPAADSLGYAPAALVAAEVGGQPSVTTASQGRDAAAGSGMMAETVQGVGDRVRRLEKALALAQKDMAAHKSLGKGDDGGGGKGGDGSRGGGSSGSSAAVAAKAREVAALQRQQRALETKNRELEAKLEAQVKRAAEQERKATAARKAAAAAKAEMMTVIVEQKRTDHVRGGDRSKAPASTAAASSGGELDVRASLPVTVAERKQLASSRRRSVGAPQTLSEAAASLLGDVIVEEKIKVDEEREARDRRVKERDAEELQRAKEKNGRQQRIQQRKDTQRRSTWGEPKTAAPTVPAARRRSPMKPKGPSFLDRVRSPRRGRPASAEAALMQSTARGKPAWNDTPDLVVTIAGPAPPPPPKRAIVAPPVPSRYTRAARHPFLDGGAAAARRRQVSERERARVAATSKSKKPTGPSPSVAFGRRVGDSPVKGKGGDARDRALREAALKLLEAEVSRVLPTSSANFVSAGPDELATVDYSAFSSVYVPPVGHAQTNTAAGVAEMPSTGATLKTPPSRKAALTKSAAKSAAALTPHVDHPLIGPATGLMTLSPRPSSGARSSGGGGGDPRAEIIAMRTILDEVVAHLRMLHIASGVTADQLTGVKSTGITVKSGVTVKNAKSPRTPKSKSRRLSAKSSTTKSKLALDFDRAGRGGSSGSRGDTGDDDSDPTSSSSPSRGRGDRGSSGDDSGDRAMSASLASSSMRLSGALVLSSLEHSRALKVLREVEENEMAMRARWGLFSPKHPPPRELTDEEYRALYRTSVTVAQAGLTQVEDEAAAFMQLEDKVAGLIDVEADASGTVKGHTAASVAAAIASSKSLKVMSEEAVQSLIDEDFVARVWEARNQYVRYQSRLDDALLLAGGPEEEFSPVEVNEEVAERLLDSLLTDVARELSGACDEATHIVLQHEFNAGAGEGQGKSGGAGRYGVGGALIDDDVVGPAIERAYL